MGKLVSVVGARPQFVKLAPVCRALERIGCPHDIIHTGQHYDHQMSEVFFDQLRIPRPGVDLNIGSGGHGAQTGAMLAALEAEFSENRPDAVIVYGDTNSTLAAALAAVKMHIPLAHIEAGLRSFNRAMPEEINRIVSDQCSDVLFAPTVEAIRNLEAEGLGERSTLVGDVMYDAVRFNSAIAEQHSTVLADLQLQKGKYAAVTIHRPINTEPDTLRSLINTLSEIGDEIVPVVFPIHPRTRQVLGRDAISANGGLRIIDPLPYLDMLLVVQNAKLVLTDSGGLQKDAAFLGTPCVTLREETEWTETIELGANVLTGSDPDRIRAAVNEIVARPNADWSSKLAQHYGDGDAADKIAAYLVDWLSQKTESVV